MKKQMIFMVLLCFSLLGCSSANMSEQAVQAELVETGTSAEHSYYRVKADILPVEQDSFSDEMKKGLEEEWERFNSLSQEERLTSSHLWGLCGEKFYEWSAGEKFLGFSVKNPLEDAEWLEKANHFALALDEENPHHVTLGWYGEPNGMITEAQMQSGYLDGDVRITLSTTATTEENGYETEMAWADEVTFEYELLEMKEGFPVLVVTPDDLGEYSSLDAYFVQNDMLYHISAVGEEGRAEDILDTLEKVLRTFVG